MTMGGRHRRKPWPNQWGRNLDGSCFAFIWFFGVWAVLIALAALYFLGASS